jgi:hypothetical protein
MQDLLLSKQEFLYPTTHATRDIPAGLSGGPGGNTLQALSAFFKHFVNFLPHHAVRSSELGSPGGMASADTVIPMKHSTVAIITNLVGIMRLLLLVGL